MRHYCITYNTIVGESYTVKHFFCFAENIHQAIRSFSSCTGWGTNSIICIQDINERE